MLTSKVRGCSGSSFTESRIVLFAIAKRPSPSLSIVSNFDVSTFSLSDAVIVILLSFISKRKQSKIANVFLLFITRANACKRLLRAVLDKKNFMGIYFLIYFLKL